MIGKQVKQRNRESVAGIGIRGPLSKEKRKSLKLASHVKKNAVIKDKCTEEEQETQQEQDKEGVIEENQI